MVNVKPLITLGLTIDDDSYPTNPDYDVSIGEHANVLDWYVVEASRVTVDSGTGRITAIVDRSDNGNDLAQASSGAQPLYVEDQIAGLPAASFGDNDFFDMDNFPASSDFSICFLVKGDVYTSGRHLFETPLTGARLSVLITADERITAGVNDGTDEVKAITPVNTVANTWLPVMVAYDHSAKTIRLSVNGGVTWATDTDALVAAITATRLRIGADENSGSEGARALIPDWMLLNVDVYDSANAALKATIQQYWRDRYLLTI